MPVITGWGLKIIVTTHVISLIQKEITNLHNNYTCGCSIAAVGGSLIFLVRVHQPASPSMRLAVHPRWRGPSRDPGVCMMWVQLKRWCVSCGYLLQRGHSGDGCEVASTLCRYVLRRGDLFVLNWARVRRVCRERVSSELLI